MAFYKTNSTGTLFATYQDVEGTPYIPADAKITIKHITGGAEVIDVNNVAMTQIGSTNQFYYEWSIDESAFVGEYLVSYTATIDGEVTTGTETVSVITGDSPEPTPSTYYSDTLLIARISGLGITIEKENLGTGDGTEDSYDFENGNVIAGSYTLYYGNDGSNELATLTETTHYTIDKDSGSILLTSAGVALVNAKKLYVSYTHSPKHSDTLLASYLASAEDEVNKLTANYWGEPKTSIQYFDGYSSGYPQTDEPFGTQIENRPEFELKYTGINSVTSIEFLDNKGDVSSDVDSDYIRLLGDDGENGRVIVTSGSIPNGKENIKITFVHGHDAVPELVKELCALICSKMAFVNVSGGSYKDISTYSLGKASFSIGQVYVNVREAIDKMQSRIDEITESLGFRFALA